jgi:hypothetical protein
MLAPWTQPSHAEARYLIVQAYRTLIRGEPTELVAELAQAVGWLETHYGAAWKAPGDGSCNWGAVQDKYPICRTSRRPGQPWAPEHTCFAYVDTKPQSNGTSTPYAVCFRRETDHVAGALELVRQVYGKRATVLGAALRGDAKGFSAALHATRYYEGWGATVPERIQHHADAVAGSLRIMRAGILGRPCTDEVRARVADPPLIDWQDLLDEADMIRERDAMVRGE